MATKVYTIVLNFQKDDMPQENIEIMGGGIYPLPYFESLERDSHIFEGWSYSPDGEKIEDAVIYPKGDTILYAIYSDIRYFNIYFNPNDGDGEMDPIKVFGGFPLPECQFTYKGDTSLFEGWAPGPGEAIIQENYFIPTEDTTLWAMWNDGKIIYKYDGPSEGFIPTPENYREYRTDISEKHYLPRNFVTEVPRGYIFKGWNTDPSANEGIVFGEFPASTGITWYAIFTKEGDERDA